VLRINGSLLGVTTPTAGSILIGDGAAWQSLAMSGDATLASTGVLTLATVNATPGTYTNATVTVNAKGLVTVASSGSGSSFAPVLVTIDFGVIPTWEVTVTIVDAGMTPGKFVFMQPSLTIVGGGIDAGAQAESFSCFVEQEFETGSFDVRVVSNAGPVVGTFTFAYVII